MKVLTISCVTGLFLLASMGPAGAGTGTASAGSATVTFSIENAIFPGPGCMQVPVRATFSSYGNLELSASRAGSSNSVSAFLYGDAGENIVDAIQVCPNIDGAGTYIVRGTLNSDDVSGSIPEGMTFTVSAAPSSITGLRATQRGKNLSITGKATAPSDRGQIGTSGTVTLVGFLPKSAGGKGKWISLGSTYADEFGNFSVKGPTAQKLKGLKVKATLKGESWFSDAVAQTTLR